MKQSPALEVRQGTNVTYPLSIKVNGVALDLTGSTITMAAKKRVADADNLAIFKVQQTSHVDPVNGLSSISLTPAQLALPGEYYYDITIKLANNTVAGTIHGKFTIIQAVVITP